MAYTRNIAPTVSETDVTFQTAVDLSTLLYTFVTVTNGVITGGATNTFVAGVLQDFPVPAATAEPAAASNATVRCGSLSLLTIGASGCSVGDKLKCGVGGLGVIAGSGQDFHAIALSSGVLNDRVLVRLEHGTA